MKRLALLALSVPLLCCAGPNPASSIVNQVGIYHWGGVQAKGVASGIRTVLDLNAHVARIALSPRMSIDYNDGLGCQTNFRLASALEQRDLQDVIGDPRLRTLIVTAYDGTTFSDCATHVYLHPAFYTPANTDTLVEEYAEFTLRLHELYGGTGKTFILANWEGDNALYCANAYGYSVSPTIRRGCDEAYPATYAGNRDPAESVEGLVLWLKARYLGVAIGNERARAAGLSGVEVGTAVEISAIHLLSDAGLKSVLYHVLPRVPFDYVSYSAYESQAQPDPVGALKRDLDFLRSLTGSARIILGEIGFQKSYYGTQQIALTAAVTNAALEWGVSFVIQWNLYDQDSANDFGLYDVAGRLTDLGAYYRARFSGDWTGDPEMAGAMQPLGLGHR